MRLPKDLMRTSFPNCSSPSMVVIFVLVAASMQATAKPMIFNVLSFGAVADGKSDNSKAFGIAWERACAWEKGRAKVVIPKGSYLTGPITFKGPCKKPIVVEVKGLVLAPIDLGYFPKSDWVVFKYVNNLAVVGRGKFHGQGAAAWTHNDCRKNSNCVALPTSIKLDFVNNTIIRGISSVDSKMFHILVYSSHNVSLRNIRVSAPADSPNTDGIHITLSSGVTITDSTIGTGDDCISIGPGTSGVHVSRVVCGPGHGISVGSLGRLKEDRDVTNLSVTNCTFTGTTNGVRIKTWQNSYSLSASNILFDDLVMHKAANPVIIDQEYCPNMDCAGKAPSSVRINNVKFRKIRGTSSTEVAVMLKCSKAVPCRGVQLEDIHLSYVGELPHVVATTACSNVVGSSIGTVIPRSCI